ncbi:MULTISPECIES: DUF7341 domain-containing protein [unclassified Nocardioides]|uniref:DUF7341 domain-containing protein n=1 Tax=unclassified Nocardioides TaxID=2615069 RepID=UPI0009F017C4|nr:MULTISPECIES: hypothetical protein [unclassified Nocardioides]GAW50599.1 hypothetical protein PD653B2_2935 [Nocardioides sp. PD653-B2]GAW57577.1 hypothetical protein PD653_5022 [Nocardioides sp. PD653]
MTDLHDMIGELTRSHRHREVYTTDPIHGTRWTRFHNTRVPSLLAQLEAASPSGEGGARGGAGFESRPAARVEALDVLVTIDREASRWVRMLGQDDPGYTDRCLTLLASLLPQVVRCDLPRGRGTCCTWHMVEHDVRSWWTQARIVTGWDTPAWRPDVTCPNCTTRGSLRIRLEERCGMCVECRDSWDPSSYQVLADHVRTESMAKLGQRSEPCGCPLPRPWTDLAVLCPKCGNASCHRATTVLQLVAVDILEGATSGLLVERYGLTRATAVRLIQQVRYQEAS